MSRFDLKSSWWVHMVGLLMLGVLCPTLGLTQTSAPPVPKDVPKEVVSRLHAEYPSLDLTGLRQVPQVPELYEFTVNGTKAYTPSSVSYVLVGELLVKKDGKVLNVTKANLLSDRAQLFNGLPFNHAIKLVYGKGERKMAIFEDPFCPYCQDLEHEMSQAGDALNATVYVFLYPFDSLHPSASEKSAYFWCAKDRVEAWKSWMIFAAEHRQQGQAYNAAWPEWLKTTGRQEGSTCADGRDVVNQNLTLGHNFGFNQTPTLLFENGSKWPGFLPLDKLQQAFDFAAQSKNQAQ